MGLLVDICYKAVKYAHELTAFNAMLSIVASLIKPFPEINSLTIKRKPFIYTKSLLTVSITIARWTRQMKLSSFFLVRIYLILRDLKSYFLELWDTPSVASTKKLWKRELRF